MEYETDPAGVFYVRIDKNRKIYVTTFIRALFLNLPGFTGTCEEIVEMFGDDERIGATLAKDETRNAEEAVIEVFKKLRPGEPATLEAAQSNLETLFFDPHRYDLSRVGRYNITRNLQFPHVWSVVLLLNLLQVLLPAKCLPRRGKLFPRKKLMKLSRPELVWQWSM